MVMLLRWSFMGENGHAADVASLRMAENGHVYRCCLFNGGIMVMLQRWSI